jgi:hypothetical protein
VSLRRRGKEEGGVRADLSDSFVPFIRETAMAEGRPLASPDSIAPASRSCGVRSESPRLVAHVQKGQRGINQRDYLTTVRSAGCMDHAAVIDPTGRHCRAPAEVTRIRHP